MGSLEHITYSSRTHTLSAVQASSRINNMVKKAKCVKTASSKLMLGSCDTTWYSDHSGTTLVTISQVINAWPFSHPSQGHLTDFICKARSIWYHLWPISSNAQCTSRAVIQCIEIRSWMSLNKLKLNDSKTEVIYLSSLLRPNTIHWLCQEPWHPPWLKCIAVTPHQCCVQSLQFQAVSFKQNKKIPHPPSHKNRHSLPNII